MKIIASIHPRRLSMAVLALGLGIGDTVLAGPGISSVVLQPNPLVVGQGFTIQVVASSDVVQAVATVDFRPWAPRLLRVTLAKQGSSWTGTGTIPADLVPPASAAAAVTVLVLDALRASKTVTVKIPVVFGGITAFFAASMGELVVYGNALDNAIVIGRDAAGAILVNGGAVSIIGGPATIGNTVLIKVFGRAGTDQITIEDPTGSMPTTQLFGEEGDDTLTGGNRDDVIDGGPGNDSLSGRGGADRLIGGGGDDTLVGGLGNDLCLGGTGNDTFVWNPGDASDTLEGQGDFDVLRFNGANIGERFGLSANGSRLRFTRDIATVTIDAAGVEEIALRVLGGADTVTVGDLSGTGVSDVHVDLAGTSGPGDGSADTVIVDGTGGNDSVTASGDSTGVSVMGLAASILVSPGEPGLDGVVIRPLAGTDTVTIDGLSGTGLVDVRVDLAGPLDPSASDAQPDRVIVLGTEGADNLAISGGPAGLLVLGLAAGIGIARGDAALDHLEIDVKGGEDTVNASQLAAEAIQLEIAGGEGNDGLTGSTGDDLLIGGNGDDVLTGHRGNDLCLGGAGNDTFLWNPGDASDTLEGQGDFDVLRFNGANIGERIGLSANGSRLRLTRDIAVVTLDAAGIEGVAIRALGGADVLAIGDLVGTEITEVRLDLAGSAGPGGDGSADTVVQDGTAGDDVIVVAGDANGVSVLGLAAFVAISGAEAALDRVVIDALAGDDVVEASGLAAAAIGLTAEGGEGNDVLIGGSGSDLLLGGVGDDVLIGGPGFDILDGGPGSNVVIQD